jgi:hypothetical protein
MSRNKKHVADFRWGDILIVSGAMMLLQEDKMLQLVHKNTDVVWAEANNLEALEEAIEALLAEGCCEDWFLIEEVA